MAYIIIFCIIFLILLIEYVTRMIVYKIILGISFREYLLQFGYRPNKYLVKVNNELKYVPLKNYQCLDFKINNYAFRGTDLKYDIRFDNNITKIAFLGDSTPFGAGIYNNKYIYSELLEAYIMVNHLKPIKSINAAVPSYTIKQIYDRLLADVLEWNPKIVILLGFGNDINLYNYLGEKWHPGATWSNLRFNLGYKLNIKLAEISAVYNLFVHFKPQIKTKASKIYNDAVINHITEYLLKIIRILNEKQIKTIVLDNPFNSNMIGNYCEEGGNDVYSYQLSEYRKSLERVCRQTNTRFIELHEFENQTKLIYDFSHFSTLGHRKVANILAKELDEYFVNENHGNLKL